MNYENLHKLIDRYEENLPITMGMEHHEQFKWQAVKIFRDVWYASDAAERPFAELFNQARKGCGWLIDNSRITSTSGVVKFAEKEPCEVKELYLDLQAASKNPDLTVRRDCIVEFGDRIEAIRNKYFPRNWKYKHDFHAVSCYLTFFAPEDNYIFRASNAKTMAKYIGFEKPLGSGWFIDLPAYYEMCDIILSALKEHESLLEKHKKYIDDTCYQDESLHLMVFDFMYCCLSYNYYHGLSYVEVSSKNAHHSKSKNLKDQHEIEEERNRISEHIAEMQEQLLDAETQLEDFEEISLVGTEVTTEAYGNGIVFEQKDNQIFVRFSDTEKRFVIHRNYPKRPRFEDEDDVVELLSKRVDLCEEIDRLKMQIEKETKRLESLY